VEGDASHLAHLNLPRIDFVMTSPRYMNRVDHPENPLTGYRTRDGTYDWYLTALGIIFSDVADHMRPGGVVFVNVANIRSNPVTTLAWDVARGVSKSFQFLHEVVLDWDHPPLFLTADYCLVFQAAANGSRQVHVRDPERRATLSALRDGTATFQR
jgi:hypothetical protein